MTYNQAIEYIHSLGKFSQNPSLCRVEKALAFLDNPQNKFKSIHIAGTNGKGSVTVMTASVLKESGYKTGMFVSPYIINFRERIQINGDFISEADLCRLCERVKALDVKLCEFEFITVMAFLYFAENGIDVAVVETGLGGRLDATNTLQNVLVSCITKIGLDHTGILGDTVEQIANEKCGIIKRGKTVTTPYQPKAALQVIKEHDKNVIIPDITKLEILKSDIGNTFIYKGVRYKTGLSGQYQIENALCAIEVLLNCTLNISDIAMLKGIESAFIPARAEIISRSPLVLLDGAHNPDGAEVLKGIMRGYKNITAIIGVMQDKDFEEVLKITLPLCSKVICVSVADMPRALDAQSLYSVAQKYCDNAVCADSYEDAVALVGKNSNLFVFGSLYLASGIRELLKETYK